MKTLKISLGFQDGPLWKDEYIDGSFVVDDQETPRVEAL